jgi:uncharacterized protein
MDVVRHDDPKAFAARTQPFLMADEARHNLLLGITTTLIERPDVYQEFHLWVVEEQRETVAAAICTPPFNLAVSRSGTDGAMAALAEGLRHDGVTFPGVSGAVPEVEDFVEAWTALIGAAGSPAMASRIYRLTNVKPVDGVSGHLRDATQEDRDLLIDWIGRFATEALPRNDPMADPNRRARAVDLRLGATGAGLVLWDEGGPVSFAGYGGRTPNGIRIGPVYTPPDLRRRGYASALVASLSQRLLDEGRTFCFLHTDLSNPTSNRIYIDIGYEPVCDSWNYRFEAPEV